MKTASQMCAFLLVSGFTFPGAIGALAAADPAFVPVTDAMLQDPDPADWLSFRRTTNGWKEIRLLYGALAFDVNHDGMALWRTPLQRAWTRIPFPAKVEKWAERCDFRFNVQDGNLTVFVNGEPAGSHEGAYTPFAFDITGRVKAGANELVVRVVDPPAAGRNKSPRFSDLNYDELPRGKQNWYIQNGGIWQPVWLDVRPGVYIDAVRVTPKVSGEFTVEADVAGTVPARRTTLSVVVRDPAGKVVASPAPVRHRRQRRDCT